MVRLKKEERRDLYMETVTRDSGAFGLSTRIIVRTKSL